MTLTVKQIEAAKPVEKAYKLTDGAGLYLHITPAGTRTWRANFTAAGKQQTVTYGRYPDISLAEARKLNVLRKSEVGKVIVPTFAAMTEKWLELKLPTLSNTKHQIQVVTTLREHVLPYIGHMPINSIPRTLLVEVVQKLSATPETAGRVAGRIDMVFNYALDVGVITSHGASGLRRVLPKKKSKPMPSIPASEAGQLLRDIQTYGEPVTRLSLLMIAHTFVRFNELQNMRWDELILDDRVWVIPAERMKMRMPHVVPLSNSVLAILEEFKQYSDGTGYVAESPLRPGKGDAAWLVMIGS